MQRNQSQILQILVQGFEMEKNPGPGQVICLFLALLNLFSLNEIQQRLVIVWVWNYSFAEICSKVAP